MLSEVWIVYNIHTNLEGESIYREIINKAYSQSLIDPSENVLPERVRRKLVDDDLFDFEDDLGSILSFLILKNRSRLCWSSQ